MSPAPEAGAVVDEVTIRSFVTMLHDAAARALKGAPDPGVLQIVRIHPNGGSPITTRFPIGAVDLMVEDAVKAASGGLNTYTEGRTVEARASRRGNAGATRAVFALIDDSDGDKGKAGVLPVRPTWSVESSPGNRHSWFVLDRALTPDEARPIGAAMRKAIGSDSATGKPEQPFRIPGTPNFPDARKRARGRVVSPTRILSATGPVWSAADLTEVFPPAPETTVADIPGGRSGATSSTVEDLAADTGEDRSGRFFDTIKAAVYAGMFPADVEDVFRRHPEGCGGKYLTPTDRLAAEIARAWGKVTMKAEEQATGPDVAPTYPDTSVPIDEARAVLHRAIAAHFEAGHGHRAIQTSTGTGKTVSAVRAIATNIRQRRAEGDQAAVLYLTPTHRLADEVVALFASEGVSARTFRGRGADDPDMTGTGQKMCLDLEAVDLALRLGLTVSTACCQLKDPQSGAVHTCPSFGLCAYQRQIHDSPAVWVGAHDLLYSAPAGLGEIGAVVVDEAFWQSGLKLSKRAVTLDEVGAAPGLGRNNFEMMEAADIAAWRSQLVAALRQQEELGGVGRRHLVAGGIDAALCSRANAAEWKLRDRIKFYPGMSRDARMAAAVAAQAIGRIGKASAVWRAARDLLEREDEAAVSGRLILTEVATEDGAGRARAVLTHGVQKIMKRWLNVPMLVMDATLPSTDVLRQFIPDIESTASIEATSPHAAVRQVVGAPVSSGKLLRSEGGRSREAVRRAILLRWIHAGRCPTLVIVQKEFETWLRDAGMPETINIAHFGAIAGLDGFKGVGLLIVVGRTLPSVMEVETYAGVLTGLEPQRTAQPVKGPRWYDRTPLGLRMADGIGHRVDGDRHPDPIAEGVRWQVAEAGVIQAIGRARAVNRTAENPVRIEVWNDLTLPLTIDEVVPWEKVPAGREADMIADGVVLESAPDMAACWPAAWETPKAAERWRQGRTDTQTPIKDLLYRDSGVCAFRYQRPGERQKWRRGWYDPTVVPDPRVWLETKTVELAQFEIITD